MSHTIPLRYKQSIVDTCKKLYDRGWLAACDGNVSLKIDEDLILVTPSQKHKGFLRCDELALISSDGEIIDGNPSSEKAMHIAVYQSCPDARGVVHAHTPVSTGWSIAFPGMKELPSNCLSEVILTLGSIPIVPYAQPGTAEMGQVLIPYLPHAHVMILANHGSLSWSSTLEEAFYGIERLEHVATTLMYAKQLGEIHPLPEKELKHLRLTREKAHQF